MALIEPDSNIRILQDIPLDNTYHDTIYWESRDAQTDYFIGKTKYNLTDQSFQRVNRNTIRVGVKIGNLYNCDYIMFQNKSFSNKWFYAFITSVEYVNNVTSEITYELDVLQTWHFNYTVDHCFIERQHTTTDKIGEHIEPEPVSMGEYVYHQSGHDQVAYGDYGVLIDCSQLCVIVAIVDVANDGATSADGQLYDGIYGGAKLYAFNSGEVAGINGLLNTFTEKPDAIVGMYMIPSEFLPVAQPLPSAGYLLPKTTSAKQFTFSAGTAIVGGKDLDGYTPKNNKMFTYPYNFYNVSNASGDSMPLRYEFFEGGTVDLLGNGVITQPVACTIRPRHYKGSGNRANNSEMISLQGFPLCSWNMDAYQAWVAQNSIPLTIGVTSSMIQSGLNMVGASLTGDMDDLTNSMIGFGSTAVSNIGKVLSQNYTASISADLSRGKLSNGSVNVTAGKNNFYGGRMCVNHVYAKMIDNFFTMFGYGIKVMGIPNRKARPHFTFTKTQGCTLHGSIPSDDLKKISAIFNNGITWWTTPSEIGDYNLDNSPS